MPESYLSKISANSDRYGNPYLLEVMKYYGVNCTAVITEDMAKAYYDKFVKGKFENEQKADNM